MKGFDYVDDNWTYTTPDLVFGHRIDTVISLPDREPRKSYFAWLEGKQRSPKYFLGWQDVGYAFGLDKLSGRFWYEIAELPDSQLSFRQVQDTSELSVQNSRFGTFRFAFQGGKLLEAHCEKNSDQIDSDNFGYITFNYSIENINFEEFAGRQLISSYLHTESYTYKSRDGSIESKDVQKSVKRIQAEPSQSTLTDKIAFADVEIPDGTPVDVKNDKGIPYEFQNGRIVKVVEKSSVIENENGRFRKPRRSGIWWYLVAGSICAVAISYLVYRRFR